MSDLNELADRVEQLTGPDRQIDAMIEVANNPANRARVMDIDGTAFIVEGGNGGDTFDRFRDVPAYTGSIDAAITLVPIGAKALIDSDGAHCRLTRKDWHWNGFAGLAGSMALAITAAALRAKAASDV